jgi:hypothetical protein
MANVAFASNLKPTAIIGMAIGELLLIVANITIQRNITTDSALKVLPMFHVAMLI